MGSPSVRVIGNLCRFCTRWNQHILHIPEKWLITLRQAAHCRCPILHLQIHVNMHILRTVNIIINIIVPNPAHMRWKRRVLSRRSNQKISAVLIHQCAQSQVFLTFCHVRDTHICRNFTFFLFSKRNIHSCKKFPYILDMCCPAGSVSFFAGVLHPPFCHDSRIFQKHGCFQIHKEFYPFCPLDSEAVSLTGCLSVCRTIIHPSR